jgi:hypothetical protein
LLQPASSTPSSVSPYERATTAVNRHDTGVVATQTMRGRSAPLPRPLPPLTRGAGSPGLRMRPAPSSQQAGVWLDDVGSPVLARHPSPRVSGGRGRGRGAWCSMISRRTGRM